MPSLRLGKPRAGVLSPLGVTLHLLSSTTPCSDCSSFYFQDNLYGLPKLWAGLCSRIKIGLFLFGAVIELDTGSMLIEQWPSTTSL